jgi:hypothetical protein
MSESIKGSKSFLYSNAPVPDIENSGDSMQHLSIQEISGKKGAADVMIHGITEVSLAHAIEAGSVRKLIKSTAHGAKQGWFMRMTSGASDREEISIIKIVDADTFIISAEFPIAIADTFDILRSVSPKYSSDGDLSVSAGPTTFLKDSIVTTVEEDTADPSNNEPLPSKLFFQKDGVVVPVNKDTGVPGNTAAVPVEIVAASGTEINITAGDINIQTTDMGASFDSMRIGDGSGNYIGVNANDEALVHDTDLLAKAEQIRVIDASIDTKTPALGQALEAASTPVVLPAAQIATLTPPAAITGFALEATQLDVETAVQSIDLKTPVLGQALEAASVPVVLTAAQIAAITPPAAISGFALETTQLDVETAVQSIDTKTPALGQALEAASVPVVLTALQLAAITPPAAITGFSLETTQTANGVLLGAVTETAPATDTASSGLNGRLQRIAQRLTSLIAQLPATLGIQTAANSLSVTLASNQAPVPVTPGALAASYQEITNLTTVAQTFTAPANAKWMKVSADGDNVENIRIKLGGVATITSGIKMEPSRAEDFAVAGNLSVIAEAGTNQVVSVTFGA